MNIAMNLNEFDCPDEGLPDGATPGPRPPHRPRQLPPDVSAGASPNPLIGPDLERFVVQLLDSSAVQKFQDSDRKNEITFADACRFWSLTESMRRDEFDAALAALVKNLIELHRTVSQPTTLPLSNRTLTVDDIRMLLSLFFHLENRFERHLALLRGRS